MAFQQVNREPGGQPVFYRTVFRLKSLFGQMWSGRHLLKSFLRGFVLLLLVATPSAPQAVPRARECACDPARPETMEARECGLCREAEKQPADLLLFFLKDNNPRKPNRRLALPRAHAPGMHDLSHLTPKQRAEFWKATVEKARSLWGDQWGLAVNGGGIRTQCHAHVHIGKLLERSANEDVLLNAESVVVPGSTPRTVKTPAKIPTPQAGEALWIHPRGKRLHVHVEDRNRATEFVLMR